MMFHPFLANVTCLLGVASAAPLFANPPGEHGDSLIGSHSTESGYIETIKAQKLDDAAEAGNLMFGDFAPAEAPPIKRRVPAILLNFQDVPPPYPVDDLDTLLFGTDPEKPTFRQYYHDMSYGQWLIEGKCYGWYELPGDRSDYEHPHSSQAYWKGVFRMVNEALRAADEDIDFSRYDVDHLQGSPVNPDGVVDALFVVHPCVGYERHNQVSENSQFRSGRYPLSKIAQYLRERGEEIPSDWRFTTNDIRTDRDGLPLDGPGEAAQNVVIKDVLLVPALDRAARDTEPARITSIGLYCHEYGHFLGLPDLYARGTQPQHWGVGNWCLMGWGSRGITGQDDRHPAPLSAWCRHYMGWSATVPISISGLIRLQPICASDTVLKIPLLSFADNHEEYLLLEYRDPDAAPSRWSINWDRSLPQAGLAIWHVDESVGSDSEDWPRADYPAQNDRFDNMLVALIQADQDAYFPNSGDRYEAEDLWTPLASFNHHAEPGEEDDSASVNFQIGTDEDGTPTLRFGTPSEPAPEIAGGQLDIEPHSRSFRISPDVGRPERAHRPRAPAALRNHPRASHGFRSPRPASAESPTIRSLRTMSDDLQWSAGGDGTLRKEDLDALKTSEKRTLKTTSEEEIEQSVPASRAGYLKQAARALRTHEVPPGGADRADVPSKVRNFLNRNHVHTSVTVRIAADGETVERIDGLNAAIGELHATHPPDGRELLDIVPLTDTESAKAKGLGYKKVDGHTWDLNVPVEGKIQEYRQTFNHQGKALPIFGTATRLYFDEKGALKTIDADAVSPKNLNVSGSLENASTTKVIQRVARQLKLNPEHVHVCREGVGLIRNDPNQARLGVELCVSSGEGRRPIHVFVDGETGKIGYIK